MREGFPHSDIRGSTIARISPRLFAACHVLHRLLAPRHPPDALVTLGTHPIRTAHQGPTHRPANRPGTRRLRSRHPRRRPSIDRPPGRPVRRSGIAARDNTYSRKHMTIGQILNNLPTIPVFTCKRTCHPARTLGSGRRGGGLGSSRNTGQARASGGWLPRRAAATARWGSHGGDRIRTDDPLLAKQALSR